MEDFLVGIDPDKRDRVINAAIEEFAAYPFEKASTNNIVKQAGISKGLLFHYFNNKQALYETLIRFVTHTLYETIVSRISWDETDLFERIKQMAIVKLEVSRTYPHMFDFILRMLSFKGTNDVSSMIDLYKSYGLNFEQLYQDVFTKNVDYARFRDPSTIAETINIVRWSLEKYGEEHLLNLQNSGSLDFANAVASLDHYVEILKHAFYR